MLYVSPVNKSARNHYQPISTFPDAEQLTWLQAIAKIIKTIKISHI